MWGAAVASAWRLGGALCARHNCARGARAAAAHATAGVSVVAEAGRKVMLVESPTKAKKIQKYLGDEYKVLASYGHVRDLPAKTGSVLPEADFDMKWSASPRAVKPMLELRAALKGANSLLLATDPDREGEAISWHVHEMLKGSALLRGVHVQRITFNEITKKALLDALAAPREISEELVKAYLARRALDYLVGFHLSPVLWRKLPGARSAGRVQSVALRLISEREAQVEAFKPEQYWTIEAVLQTEDGVQFGAQVVEVDGQRLGPRGFADHEEAQAVVGRLKAASLEVGAVKSRASRRNPPAPYTTSTMQQDAARRLGMTASVTMRAAQALYEGEGMDGEGLITYMRTDGVTMAASAIEDAGRFLKERLGPEFVSDPPRVYTSRAKNAQEAHEAVRPVDMFLPPKKLPRSLDDRHRALYTLIWQRAVASQAASAVIEQVGVDVFGEGGALVLRSTASSVKFAGYLAVYNNASADEESASDEEGQQGEFGPSEKEAQARQLTAALGALEKGQPAHCAQDELLEHWTKPPPRFNEGSLIKQLEELGIGRPSTYAPTMKLLQDRGYVLREGRVLIPSSLGRVLSEFLKGYFEKYIDYDFTATMEAQLDEVSAGKADWKQLLTDFWHPFAGVVDATKDEGEGGADPRDCPACGTGKLGLKLSRTGGFIGCSNYGTEGVDCKFARSLGVVDGSEEVSKAEMALGVKGFLPLGKHPDTGEDINVRLGPYGLYLQQEPAGDGAEAAEEGEKKKKTKKKPKPRRASLPKGSKPEEVTLEMALEMLSLPKQVLEHPGDGQPILLCSGPYGYYVKHGELRLSIVLRPAVLEILNAKVARLTAKKANGGDKKAGNGSSKKDGRTKARKPPSAYLLFCQDERQRAAEVGMKLSLKELGERWRAVPEADREGYKARATAAAKELAQEAAATAVAADGGAEHAAASMSPRKGGRKPSKKAATRSRAGDAPKRPPSAYLLFCQAERPTVVAEHSEANFGEVARLLGERWRQLPEGEKERFQAMAKEGAAAGGA
eukprot:jgi/Tetstr1/454424/TSEL_041325.t1